MSIICWVLLVGFCLFIYFGNKIFSCGENKEINSVFAGMSKMLADKNEKIQNLFIDSASFVNEEKFFENNLQTNIFTMELALHIFSLWLALKTSEFAEEISDEVELNAKLGIEAYFVCIKQYLNLLIVNSLHHEELDSETVKSIVYSRVKLILSEKDFKARNSHFLNLCANECKFEYSTYLASGDLRKLPLIPSSPLLLSFLPRAYTVGLVDKYKKCL